MPLFLNFFKQIHFYTFVESIKNQIQIIKINYISLDYGSIYSSFNNIKIKVIVILLKKINKINMKNNLKRII